MHNPFSKMGGGRTRTTSHFPIGWLLGLLSSRHIEQRVIENLPSWREFADQKLRDAQDRKDGQRIELPPHRVDLSSPLQWNVLYLLLAGGALGLAYATPTWATYLIYGAIFGVFGLALLVTFRDGVFFHLEAHRLDLDGEMINKRSSSEEAEAEAERKAEAKPGLLAWRKKTVFRSSLMQIHYQNILRTFESGARRTWVYQDASITDIQTLLSQRGMKLTWTLIEVLPQLGLLGTLIGLTQMFQAFHVNALAPELSILTGFGTALGTTLLANLFVLVLRPLHMRNERAMNEILSTLQMLMAMFILPTQQAVLDRAGAVQSAQGPSLVPYASGPSLGERRFSESLEQLSRQLSEFTELHRGMDSGVLAARSADVVHELRNAVRAFSQVFDPRHLEQQQRGFTQVGQAMRELTTKLDQVAAQAQPAQAPAAPPEPAERTEHDLLQLRVLTHDTLLLLERISGQLGQLGGSRSGMLSDEPRVRAMAFPEPEAELDRPGSVTSLGAPLAGPTPADGNPASGPERILGRPRAFRERR